MKILNKETKPFAIENMPELGNLVSFHIFKPGQFLFYNDHLPYGVYILMEGSIEIEYSNDSFEVVTAPALLGIYSFLRNEKYSGTAKVLSESKIYFLSLITFKHLISENNPVVSWINNRC